MRRFLPLLALLAVLSGHASAQDTAAQVKPGYTATTGCLPGFTSCYKEYGQYQPTKSGIYTPVASGQFALTVASATGLTVPSGATVAQICVETAAVRYRDDGTAPTASTGMPVAAGTCFQYAGSLAAIQFIAQTGSPTLDVLYYK